MQKILIDLSTNLQKLQSELLNLISTFFENNLWEFAEQLTKQVTLFFSELSILLEHLKLGKLADAVLHFLDKTEAFLTDVFARYHLPDAATLDAGSKMLIHLVRTQVIYLDQQRQSLLTF
ncbi:MAG: hypothetical protein JNL95_13810 [Chitinophagales bacterium]|nr:hypothetical protein [Chitinophagales bacterium]